MNALLGLVMASVTTGLLILTVLGAYALTGSIPITMVLVGLVALQWVSARRAMDAIRGHGATTLLGRWGAVLGYSACWLVVASLTVSFVGGELFGLLAAKSAATERFEAEQRSLRSRARDIQQAVQGLAGVMNQYVAHAQAMADLESARGGSCAVTMGSGPGEIRAFRQADARAAVSMVSQLTPSMDAATATMKQIEGMRFAGAVPELRRALSQGVDDANAVPRSPLWEQVQAFAKAANANAASISIGAATFACADPARGLLLEQLSREATRLAALPALPAPQLLDHADARDIALSTVVRTWASALDWLPARFWGGRPVLDARFKARFAVDDKAVLGPNNLPLVLAWVLEGVMVALLFMLKPPVASHAAGQPAAHIGARLWHWLMLRQRERSGLVGELARATAQPAPGERRAAIASLDASLLFADDDMAVRAATLAPWYLPWGNKEVLVIPLPKGAAVRAARELAGLGQLRMLATGISTAQLLRDPRLAATVRATLAEVPDTVWLVYQVTGQALARWLLTCPVEAQAILSRQGWPEAA